MIQQGQPIGHRRSFVEIAASFPFLVRRFDADRRPARSQVAILNADSYTESLVETLFEGLKLFDLDASNKSVLLKPNLVDYIPGAHINTHPLLVSAAAECFKRLGARSVVVGEGPGHQRDTYLVLHESGLLTSFRESRFHSLTSIAMTSPRSSFVLTIPDFTKSGCHGQFSGLTSLSLCRRSKRTTGLV